METPDDLSYYLQIYCQTFDRSKLSSYYRAFESLQGFKPDLSDKLLLRRHIEETWHLVPREIYLTLEEFFIRFGYEPRKYRDIPSELVIW